VATQALQRYRFISGCATIASMKPLSVPRLDSLLHRLQHAPGAEDSSYLDQLMIFLDDPPPGVSDRWKEGAKMCSDWGIPCTGASVWRLYRSHALEWRVRLAREAGVSVGETPESLTEKTAHMVTLRTFEVLANPQSPPAALVGLARIELRKKALEFARQKHQDSQTDLIQIALDALEVKVRSNWEATFALGQLKAALRQTKPSPPPYLTPSQPSPAVPLSSPEPA
jgi:hypothetical protein